MTLTLRDEVEQIINQRGKMTRTALYCQFELVAKRALDSALEDLARTHRIVLGATEVAPVRAAKRDAQRQVFGVSVDDHASLNPDKQPRRARWVLECRTEPTIRERIIAALDGGTVLSVRELTERLNQTGIPLTGKVVRGTLSRMNTADEVKSPAWGKWTLKASAEAMRGATIPRRLLALFQPGVMLSRQEIRERMGDANNGTVSAALHDLVQGGKLLIRPGRGYMLPTAIQEDAAA